MTVEDFLIRALNDNFELYLKGPSSQIMANLRERVFNSTSRFFLGFLIFRILERESERLPEEIEVQLHQVAQEQADRIIADFEKRFRRPHRWFFKVVAENPDWFMEALRR